MEIIICDIRLISLMRIKIQIQIQVEAALQIVKEVII